MRLDKFLKVSRILKRRSVGKAACDGGRVSINGRPAKPGAQLKIGDVVEVGFGQSALRFRVKELSETVKKDDASNLYEILGEEDQ